MNDIKNEFFSKHLSKKKEKIGSKTICSVVPEYGNGKIITYEIIRGMYLLYNELDIANTIINKTNKMYSSPVFKIDYCIDGTYICNCPYDKVSIVRKGSSTYYVGTENFIDLNFKGKKYKSISIFCYLNEITNSFEEIFGVSKEKIEEYYEKLINRKDYLMIETDIQISHIINEILKYIKYNNVELIKLRTIELFLLEITNYENRKIKKEKYYKKSTIDKVDIIKTFIEENMQDHITIDNLSNRYNICTTELKECFKYVNGMGLYTYLKSYRMQTAKELLVDSNYNILEIANITGYSNQSNFGAVFKNFYGITPLKYRKIFK